MLSKLAHLFQKKHLKRRSRTVTACSSSANRSSAEIDLSHCSGRNQSTSPSHTLGEVVGSEATDNREDELFASSYSAFLQQFPSYIQTHDLDLLREREFGRVRDARAIYMDYMGACLYPDFLVRDHLQMLNRLLVGNTHSDSPSSTLSERHVSAARHAVLSFFNAPAEDYVCIFTSNCTSALKLVGESFPFDPTSHFVLAEDSHNSVNGIRKFAESKGAIVHYVPSRLGGGFDELDLLRTLQDSTDAPSLLALTGQSNISAFRPGLPKLLAAAKRNGYSTLIDGAALASTSRISLAATSCPTSHLGGKVDALAISFYKMFGYPTGVGALIARKDFLRKLKRPWFSGGTVDIVGFPRTVTESKVEWERFEEGTLNYTALIAIPAGLNLLNGLISGPAPMLPLRLGILHQWIHEALERIIHSNGAPVVKVLTSRRDPTGRNGAQMGYILSLTFHTPTGNHIRPTEVSNRAADMGISLRTGCMCNPGGAIGLLGLRDEMVRIWDTVTEYADIEKFFGEDVGVIRLSLGLVTNFRDVWEVERFVKGFAQ